MIKFLKRLLQTSLLAATLLGALVTMEARADALIVPFLGKYTGHATYTENDVEINRDLGVLIRETDEGFKVDWEVTTLKPGKKAKTKEYSISFTPTKRDHVFQAAMQPSIFGGKKPLDPIKGDPYVWARILDETLTIFALLINDDGGYELLIYDRSLADNGLSLNYSRIQNGNQLKTITSFLEKSENSNEETDK
jgi:hypothetical protein